MKKLICRFGFILLCLLLADSSKGTGIDARDGAAGNFGGLVTSGGAVSPYSGNATRVIEDIGPVPGCVGAYPLKWTRTLSTRFIEGAGAFGLGGRWTHSYGWTLNFPNPYDYSLTYPDGRNSKPEGGGHYGVEPLERLTFQTGGATLILPDGGKVIFEIFQAFASGPTPTPGGIPTAATFYQLTALVDPYGLTTRMTYDSSGRLYRVTEPGGRYLQIEYVDPQDSPYTSIKSVAVFDGRPENASSPSETVHYYYHNRYTPYFGVVPCLTSVEYERGAGETQTPTASYSYRDTNCLDPNRLYIPYPLVETATDPRYSGPMGTIKYEYMPYRVPPPDDVDDCWGQVWREENLNGVVVTELEYPDVGAVEPWRNIKRWPGDPQRVFHYAVGGVLLDYQDFEHHTTHLSEDYIDPPWTTWTPRFWKEVTDARGYTTRTEHEGVIGAVTKVIYPAPEGGVAPTETFEYTDPANPYFLKWKVDERLNKTTYTRDDPHHPNAITRIDYPDGGFELFRYNDLYQITWHQLTSGWIEEFEYERGLKTKYTPPATLESDPERHPTLYYYYGGLGGSDGCGGSPYDRPYLRDRLRQVVDGNGHNTWYYYNERGQVTRVTHDDCSYTLSHYNSDGTLEWTEDELRHRVSYLYDNYKRVLRTTRTVNGQSEPIVNEYGRVGLDESWHTTPSVFKVTSPGLKVITYDYDRNFRRKQMTQAPGIQGDEANMFYYYDEVGNQISVKDPRLKFTDFTYDERNRLTSIFVEELNQTTSFEYDPAGNKILETRPDGASRGWDHDEMNRVWHAYDWHWDVGLDVATPTTIYTYDHAGNVQTITDPKGAIYTYQFDALGRKTAMWYPTDATPTERKETWDYDFAGNLILYRNPDGQYQHFEYDARNRQQHSYWNGSISPNPTPNPSIGPDITTVFDDASRVTQIKTNGGETIIGFHYDEANRKDWEDQTVAGHTWRVHTPVDADGLRQNLQITDPPNKGGNLVKSPEMKDSGFDFVQYGYTGRGQVKRISSAADGAWAFVYAYDPSGNVTRREARTSNEVVTSAINCPTYDALNRPGVWEQEDMGGVFARSHYEYDWANREKSVSRDEDNNRGDRFEYEDNNQLKRVTYDTAMPSPTTSPGSTPPGQTPAPTPPTGQVGTPVFMPDGGEFVDSNITVFIKTDPADATVHYTLDGTTPTHDSGRLLGPSRVVSFSLERGAVELQAIASKPGMADSQVYIADYAQSSEPLSPSSRQTSYHYTLDKLNRESVTENGATTNYSLKGLLNQYDVLDHGGGAQTTLAYDYNFNLTSTSAFNATYNAANQLVAVNNNGLYAPGPLTAQFVYDGLGRCVRRTVNGVATLIVYDGWKPIAEWYKDKPEYFESWNVYGPGPDELLLRHEGKYGYLRFQQDPHGNVMFLLDETGKILERYTYDAFGHPKITDPAGNVRSDSWYNHSFLFQGREYFRKLGIYDYRHRFYYPELGRFLQADPMSFGAGDMNLFRYCHNDPVNHTDPMGLLAFSGTAEYQKLMPVLGSNIPQWVTTLAVSFTLSGNFSNSNAASHVVAAASSLLGGDKGRTYLTGAVNSNGAKMLTANLNIDYYTKATRYDALEKQHTWGVEGGGDKTKGVLESGGIWDRFKNEWAGGISDFFARWRLQQSLNGYISDAKREQGGTWDAPGGSHRVPW